MRDQRDPTPERLRELLPGNPGVVLEWDGLRPTELDSSQRKALDDLIEFIEEGIRLLLNGASCASADDGAALDAALEDLCRCVGAKLRELNGTGIFISADRGSQERWSEDVETGELYPMVATTVRLKVRTPASATA
jgi:hypothetical protein